MGGSGHFLDPVVVLVGDEEVAARVQSHPGGQVDAGRGGRPPVAGVPGRAGAGHGVDVAGGHGYAPLGMGSGGHFLGRLLAWSAI